MLIESWDMFFISKMNTAPCITSYDFTIHPTVVPSPYIERFLKITEFTSLDYSLMYRKIGHSFSRIQLFRLSVKVMSDKSGLLGNSRVPICQSVRFKSGPISLSSCRLE